MRPWLPLSFSFLHVLITVVFFLVWGCGCACVADGVDLGVRDGECHGVDVCSGRCRGSHL
jgi:hypothetical protein